MLPKILFKRKLVNISEYLHSDRDYKIGINKMSVDFFSFGKGIFSPNFNHFFRK